MTHPDDAQLLERLDRRLAEIEAEIPSPPSWRTSVARVAGPRLTLGRPLGAARLAVAAVFVALIGGLMFAGAMTTPRGESAPAAGASASASVTASPAGGGVATDEAWWYGWAGGVARIDAATSEEIIIPTASETAWLLPTHDAIWALGIDDIHRIDRVSRMVTDSIDIPGGPAIAMDGSLWLWSMGPDGSSLVEIDLETRTVSGEYLADDDPRPGDDSDPDRSTDPRWIGVVGGAIWLHEWEGHGAAGSIAEGQLLTRFDLESRAFTDRIGLDEAVEYVPGSCCMAVDDAIWLPGPMGTGTLLRFDVATLEVADSLVLGPGYGAPDAARPRQGVLRPGIVADGAIWVSGPRTVYRIDPVTKEVTDIDVPTFRDRAPVYGNGAVWVAGGTTLSRIDVGTLEVSELRVTTTPECRADYTPAVGDGVVWIWAGSGESCRVDLDTGEITRWR